MSLYCLHRLQEREEIRADSATRRFQKAVVPVLSPAKPHVQHRLGAKNMDSLVRWPKFKVKYRPEGVGVTQW